MVNWLQDKADINNLSVLFKKINKRNEEGFSITLSKDLKEFVKEEGYTNVRFGYDSVTGSNSYYIVLALNNEGLGLPLLNDKDEVKNWTEVTSYIGQYIKASIDIPLEADIKLVLKKNGLLESLPI